MVFCATAISSMGISTPRSPLATITPSVTSRISSIFSQTFARSILATIKGSKPISAAAALTSFTSRAVLTKDWPTASTPFSRANCIHSRSRGVKALTPRSIPGIFKPFLERSFPPTIIVQWMSSPTTSSTRSSIRPSFRKRVSPLFTALGNSFMVMETRSTVPIISSAVRVKRESCSRVTNSSARSPTRIFGPGKSARIATLLPLFLAAVLIFFITSA